MTLQLKVFISVAVVALLAVTVAFESARPAVLGVHFLDVGQGDAICIETPGGRQVLIDGGRGGSGVLEELSVCAPFYDRSLDVLIATHMDEDHVGGLVEVLQYYEVEMVVASHDATTEVAASFWAAVEAEGARVVAPAVGTRMTLDEEVFLDIVGPSAALDTASDNERSVIAKLNYRNDSFLFTGDVERRGEYALLSSGFDLDADVLKVAHHGSTSSSTEAFLAAVTPRVAVVQVGKNSYGHPAAQVLGRLAGVQVLRTDENGTISLYSSGDSF